MAFRGSPASLDQAGQITLVFDERPVAGVDYGFTGSTENGASGFAHRTFATEATHEARTVGGLGAVTVRFSAIPATDGPDPGGLDGVGEVHGTIAATLVPTAGSGDVTVQGTF
jgi:hypothetical protein